MPTQKARKKKMNSWTVLMMVTDGVRVRGAAIRRHKVPFTRESIQYLRWLRKRYKG